MTAEIISIGDELLIGQTTNTNAVFLGKGLSALGLEVKWVTTIGDDAEELTVAFARAMDRSDVVIATGGLGPTHDDITKKVVAEFFQSDLVLDPHILDRLKRAFEKRRIQWAKVNEGQAMVPVKAEVLDNPVGTAPGLLFRTAPKRCFILPGVPKEMIAICEASVFPMLKGSGQNILHKTIRTTGIAESVLFERLGDIREIEQIVKVAFLPKFSGVDIRLTVKGTDADKCRRNLDAALALIQARAGKFIYGTDEEDLAGAVGKLLREQKQTLAVAESCTGGLIASRLTDISGSSDYFERGVVSYSDVAKVQILGVRQETLQLHGAVSAETAIEMAEGIRRISKTHFGLSTTGIAGPTGGTKEKPVGLIFVGVCSARGSSSKELLFTKDRLSNKERFAQAALNLLRLQLQAS